MRTILEHAISAIRAGAAAVAFQQAGTAVAGRRDSRRMGNTGETDVERESEAEQREAETRLAHLEADVAELKELIRCLLDLYGDEEAAPRSPTPVS